MISFQENLTYLELILSLLLQNTRNQFT